MRWAATPTNHHLSPHSPRRATSSPPPGDGTITKAEFAPFYEKLKSQAYHDAEVKQRAESKIFKLKGRSRALIGGLGAAALFLLISILLNFAMVFGVVDGQVATTVPADSALLEVKGSDRIVQTAAAEEALPLAIAPLLDEATLDRIKSPNL